MFGIINPSLAGISGDMTLGALIDAGASQEILEKFESLPSFLDKCDLLKVKIEKAKKRPISGTRVLTEIEEEYHHMSGKNAKRMITKVSNELNVQNKTKDFALQILEKILKAETAVHGASMDEVHLHETGSVDTVVDILGTGMLLNDLQAFDMEWYSLPLVVGGGYVDTMHGRLTVPAPATLEILKNEEFPFQGGPVNAELATPTGVAILTQIVDKPVQSLPLLTLDKIGYGLGSKEFKEQPNVLQVLLGSTPETLTKDNIFLLQSNVDEETGELTFKLLSHSS